MPQDNSHPVRSRVACVTCLEYAQLYEEDRPLLDALARRGIDAEPAVWDDPHIRWADFDLVLVRSPWDCHSRSAEFLHWYTTVSEMTEIHNSLAVVRGNQHKGYLRTLEQQGAPVIPTAVVEKPSDAPAVAAAQGWGEAVLKPATAMGGDGVYLLSEADTEALEATFTGDWIVQPFLPRIREEGELSLIYINGKASHAVRKRPAAGEIRVHESRGGSHTPHPLNQELLEVGEAVIDAAAVRGELVARVDLIRGRDGRLLLCELELTSPRVFFCHFPSAVDTLADAVQERLLRRASAGK
ncbi:hypothetical protein [Streptomyces sp. NPDC051014]|uniref:ATP-grasp domain-containing protein n=1 Tax=Streptomyces sp. NPDC051014 TaxID=3155751 RepID=UPI0033E61C21